MFIIVRVSMCVQFRKRGTRRSSLGDNYEGICIGESGTTSIALTADIQQGGAGGRACDVLVEQPA